MSADRGMPVQVYPIRSKLNPPGTKRLKLKHDELPSNFGFKFNLRRYTVADGGPAADETLCQAFDGDARLCQTVVKPTQVGPARCCSPRHPATDVKLSVGFPRNAYLLEIGGLFTQGWRPCRTQFKLCVGSGIEGMVSNPVRPVRTVHFDNPTDKPTVRPGCHP